MDNISLSYSVPNNLLKKVFKVQNMRISLGTSNPFTITGWDYSVIRKKIVTMGFMALRTYNMKF